jgi:4-amino-4-deoxy-L-arabinose transferase-like glycosyltransferase
MRPRRWRAGVVVGALVALGLLVRAAAYTGQSFSWGSDESRYLGVVQNLANGYFPSGDTEWFGSRVGLLWPVAALFRLIHPSDAIAALWPLAASLAGIVAAYLLGRDLATRNVGFVAAALVAVTPIEALVGARLRPDAIVPAIIAFAVWCAIHAGRSRRAAMRWAFTAGLLLGVAWTVRENAVLLAPVLIVAGRQAGRRGLLHGLAGAAVLPFVTCLTFAVGAGAPLRPLVGAGTEGVFRNPLDAFRFDDSYMAVLARATFDPGSPFFFLSVTVAAMLIVGFYVRDRRAWLPGLWLAWVALYLEFGTLVNLGKPTRYLTLCTIPCALVVAMAFEGRFGALAPIGLALVCMAALWNVPGRGLRHDDSTLVARVAERLRNLPEGPVLAESYTWYAKLGTYTARRRLAVPRAVDPEFVSPDEAAAARLLDPLPDPADFRSGYLVTSPVHPRQGWPSNWRQIRAPIRAEVNPDRLELVAEVGPAMIWRWRQ